MGKVIAAYGGGFKPPTKGHFQVVEDALSKYPEIDEFIIYVGSGTRDGISQLESILVWEVYSNYLPMKVKIEPSKSPIGDIIRLGKNNPQDTVYFIIGSREGNEGDQKDYESRTKNIEEKYPNMEIKLITTSQGGISGTKARKALLISPEEFYKFTPEVLNDNERGEVFDTLRQSITETSNLEDGKSAPFGSGYIEVKEIVNFISLEKTLDDMFEDLGIDINFTTHFKERVIERGLTEDDIVELMEKIYNIYGDEVADLDRNENRVFSHLKRLVDIAAINKGYGDDYLKDLVLKTAYKRKSLREPEFRTNMSSPKLKVNENASYSKDISIQEKIDQLTQHMLDKGMNIEPLPKVEFVDGDSDNAREFLGKTAYYNPETQTITLFTEGRHPKDIVRSFSHEMIHHIQNLEGRLGNITTTNTQEDDNLNDIEAEANLKGTMTFRNWTDSLNEAIVGDKIECDNCDWSWNIVDGGDDLFICHKCGHDNTPLGEKKNKDPFGLNQYARELASDLGEAITLNEGRYDKITNQVSREVFTKFKEIYDSGAKKGNFTFSVGPDDEEIFSNDLEFNLEGYMEVSDEMYQPDGGANAGYDDGGEEITPLIQVSFKIPQDPKEFKWSEVSFDIKDIIRHEIEHLTQDGENIKSGKYLEDDQLIRKLIDAKMLPKSQYFKLEKEVDAMLQGLYFRAKKSRTPFKEVILDYFDKVGLTKEEQKQILNVWRKRRKALALPTF
ncbi:hypothetical protein N9P60_00350 [bacterium]|nr:hypothetical protein [bacterium]MDB4319879.1 hypothetical protein [bacterium]